MQTRGKSANINSACFPPALIFSLTVSLSKNVGTTWNFAICWFISVSTLCGNGNFCQSFLLISANPPPPKKNNIERRKKCTRIFFFSRNSISAKDYSSLKVARTCYTLHVVPHKSNIESVADCRKSCRCLEELKCGEGNW